MEPVPALQADAAGAPTPGRARAAAAERPPEPAEARQREAAATSCAGEYRHRIRGCYRFAAKLRKEREKIAGCLDALAASLREQRPDRQAYSNPMQPGGHRSAVSTRTGGGFYGYKIHAAVCAWTRLRLSHHTDEWRTLYRGRSAVEREFGRLKHEYGLAPLRTQGIERVRIHADLTMLARLGQALSRLRAVPMAA